MDADQLESGETSSSGATTTPSSISVPGDTDTDASRPPLGAPQLEPQHFVSAPGCAGQLCCLPRSMTEPVLHRALHVFLADTVMAGPGNSTSKGHFANLIELVRSCSASDALPSALETVSLASLASRSNDSQIQLQAWRRYGTSVRRLRRSRLESRSDVLSTIASIHLLSLYEVGAYGQQPRQTTESTLILSLHDTRSSKRTGRAV